jgi:DNA-binding response OmpR family regulator
MAEIKVLLVEDDQRISEPLIRVLRSESFNVTHVATGMSALALVDTEVPALVLLDLTLPDIDGLDVCRRLRADHPSLPIIMLTARAEEMDVIVGLGAGADDYVAKPFRLAELVARIKARLRLAEQAGARQRSDGPLVGAGVELYPPSRRCFVDDEGTRIEIELTSKEFDLLELLMSQPSMCRHCAARSSTALIRRPRSSPSAASVSVLIRPIRRPRPCPPRTDLDVS